MTATEADNARWKLARAHELLDDVHAPAGRVERIRGLLDGIGDDVDALEKKAYLTIRVPSFLRRRRATA